MKPLHLLLHLLASFLGTSSEKCESEQVTEFPDGPHNLQCYYIKEIENGLNCTWNHGKHHTNTTTYTLKIYRIGKTHSLNKTFTTITGTFYVIERKHFYISENTTISITTVEQRSRMYQNTTSITLIPKDSEKPATPSDIKYTKHEGQLKLTWSTSKELEYELAYRKAGTCNWLSVHFQPSGTLQGLERLAAYEFRMRCKIRLWSSWTKIYHVPPELIDKPQVYTPVTELMQEPGKRRFTIRWENAATANSTIVQGYNITIERIPTNQSYDIQSIETFSKECVFILSQAFFKFRVLAYNSASFSPANEIILPSFNQMSLNNRINATPQGNNSILISWNSDVNRQTRVYIIDWGPVIGNKAHIQSSKRIKKNHLNFTLKVFAAYGTHSYALVMEEFHVKCGGSANQHGCSIVDCETLERYRRYTPPDTFKPKQRYRIMLHSKTKKIPINNTEITIGVVDVYTLEGTPRIGPSNINVTNISKTSAMIRWDPIPEDECQGFLQGYKIFYYVTKSAVGNIYSPISVNSSTTFYMLTGLLRKTLYTVQISGFTNAGEGIRSKAVSFDTKEYNDGEIKAIAVGISITIIIFVFLVTWRCLFLFRRIKEIFWPSIPNPGNSYVIRIIGKDSLLPQLDNELLSLKTNLPLMEDLESLHIIEEVTNTSTDCQLQENEENSVTDQDCNSNLSNKPAFIQVTDYTTMENFRQIVAGTKTAIQPSRCETEFNNQQNGCLIQSYMKQQVHRTSIQTPEPIGIACD